MEEIFAFHSSFHLLLNLCACPCLNINPVDIRYTFLTVKSSCMRVHSDTVVPLLLQSCWRQYRRPLSICTPIVCFISVCLASHSRALWSKNWKAAVFSWWRPESKHRRVPVSGWLRRGHLSLEDKPYCKSDHKDVELDLSLNSSAE